jgi:signal transduction histidine kinase
MTFTPKKTIIGQMLYETVKIIQSSADVKNIKINVELEDKIPELTIDQDRIKQVIMNILENAIKFSPDKTTVFLRAKKQENNVLFEIQDFGQGISKDKQKKIFNAFYRADEGKNREFSGGGIGLALSRGIITIHGGKIWVESQEGKGSTFGFTLPIKPIDNIQKRYRKSDIFGSKQADEDAEINKKFQ